MKRQAIIRRMRVLIQHIRVAVGEMVSFRKSHPVVFFFVGTPTGLVLWTVSIVYLYLGFMLAGLPVVLLFVLAAPTYPIVYFLLALACEQLWFISGIYRLLGIQGWPIVQNAEAFAVGT